MRIVKTFFSLLCFRWLETVHDGGTCVTSCVSGQCEEIDSEIGCLQQLIYTKHANEPPPSCGRDYCGRYRELQELPNRREEHEENITVSARIISAVGPSAELGKLPRTLSSSRSKAEFESGRTMC